LSNKDKILVGTFGAPVGLNGKIKVNIMTSTFEVFKNLNSYCNFDGTIILNFKEITFKGKKCVVHLDNCYSFEDALKFKGEKIYSSKNNLPSIGDNEYYVNDLIGCKVFIKDNIKTGEVIDVKNFGAGDLLEIKFETKIILIPFNKENNVSVNLNKKEIVAKPITGIID
tara:strand:+ start:69 stop:575 length:507 start_codon:yes stop_codon:yes gene_type:complete